MIFGGEPTTGPYCTDDSLRIALAGASLMRCGSAATLPRPATTSSTVSGGRATPSAVAERAVSTIPFAVRTPTWSTPPSRRVVNVIPRVAAATSAALAAATSVGAAMATAVVPARNAPRDGVIAKPPSVGEEGFSTPRVSPGVCHLRETEAAAAGSDARDLPVGRHRGRRAGARARVAALRG